jgi:single-stranded DNA-binding protein
MNSVLLAGLLGRDVEDYPADPDTGKKRFCRLSLGLNPRGRKGKTTWLPIVAYGSQVDWIVEQLDLRKGDRISVEGFLSTNYEDGDSGRRRRYVQVVATKTYSSAPSKSREEAHFRDLEGPIPPSGDGPPF